MVGLALEVSASLDVICRDWKPGETGRARQALTHCGRRIPMRVMSDRTSKFSSRGAGLGS